MSPAKRLLGRRPDLIRPNRSATAFQPRLEWLEERIVLSVEPFEMELIYILNRARHDPVRYQMEYNVQADLSGVTARPPLAINPLLQDSSQFHATEMATFNYFGHQSPITGDWPNKMARDAGYNLPAFFINEANYIESIAAGTNNPEFTIRLLIEDPGFDPPGHRIHLLAMDPFFVDHREIGVGYAFNASSLYWHYWAIHTAYVNTNNTFLTGTVFDDLNGNGRYDAGEGLPGVTVQIAGGGSTTTNEAGGWSIATTAGSRTVSVGGGGFSGTASASVNVVTGQNRSIDFLSGRSSGVVSFNLQNQAPVLEPGTSILPPIFENDNNPVGAAVSDFASPWITDGDSGAVRGIAITSLTGSQNGSWQFSTDGGASYQNIGPVSPQSALLLRSIDLVRFFPNAGFVGDVAFDFVAWDRTLGTVGMKADTTFRGIDSAYSVDQRTALLSVIEDPPPLPLLPVVQAVFVSGTTWSTSFLAHLETSELGSEANGYRVPTGSSDQFYTLPWNNIDTISIQFNEPMDFTASALTLHGVNATYNPALANLTFSPDQRLARWTFATPFAVDKLRIELSDLVTSIFGLRLDGEWIDGVSTQSGDGEEGGVFRFRLNVLPGNASHTDLSVSPTDWNFVRSRLFQSPGMANYTIFADINGSGGINPVDWNAVRSQLFSTLNGLGDPSGAMHSLALAKLEEPDVVMPLVAILGPTPSRTEGPEPYSRATSAPKSGRFEPMNANPTAVNFSTDEDATPRRRWVHGMHPPLAAIDAYFLGLAKS